MGCENNARVQGVSGIPGDIDVVEVDWWSTKVVFNQRPVGELFVVDDKRTAIEQER